MDREKRPRQAKGSKATGRQKKRKGALHLNESLGFHFSFVSFLDLAEAAATMADKG